MIVFFVFFVFRNVIEAPHCLIKINKIVFVTELSLFREIRFRSRNIDGCLSLYDKIQECIDEFKPGICESNSR